MSNAIPRIKYVKLTIVENEEEKKKTITIKKPGLGKWKQLSDTLDNIINALPDYLEEQGEEPEEFIENMEPIDLIEIIPSILRNASEEIIKLLNLGTGLEPDFIDEHVALDEAYEIFQAISEVSGLKKLTEKFPFLKVIAQQQMRNQLSPVQKQNENLTG